LKGLTLPLLLPGIKVQNNPSDVTPIRQIQMARFDGKTWALFGDILGDQ
jgi:branched-chain amino acid transport system substrate-binding protein